MTQPSLELSPSLEGLIEENLLALAQLRGLLHELMPATYRQPSGPGGRHTLGVHVRHIIDHYDALLAGLEGAGGEQIDYEHRRRDEMLEHWPTRASERLASLEASLIALVDRQPSSRLTLDYPLDEDRLSLGSTIERELAFLTSHTIHHMAILALLAERLGVSLPESFGVHPSTLRHWRREAMRVPVTAEGV
ncbi:DinB family protein [Halomonas sp. MA07-2]|uniref:DinB family protein n=1 Tax=Halomonas sp. MA07-2 TaxID=3440841 RepID=UPI003EE9A5D3